MNRITLYGLLAEDFRSSGLYFASSAMRTLQEAIETYILVFVDLSENAPSEKPNDEPALAKIVAPLCSGGRLDANDNGSRLERPLNLAEDLRYTARTGRKKSRPELD